MLNDLYVNHAYTVAVLAHSMGNVVTGEALRIAGQQGQADVVNVYVATQAAISGNCYDASLSGNDLLNCVLSRWPTLI